MSFGTGAARRGGLRRLDDETSSHVQSKVSKSLDIYKHSYPFLCRQFRGLPLDCDSRICARSCTFRVLPRHDLSPARKHSSEETQLENHPRYYGSHKDSVRFMARWRWRWRWRSVVGIGASLVNGQARVPIQPTLRFWCLTPSRHRTQGIRLKQARPSCCAKVPWPQQLPDASSGACRPHFRRAWPQFMQANLPNGHRCWAGLWRRTLTGAGIRVLRGALILGPC
jgi:hypothetical protein